MLKNEEKPIYEAPALIPLGQLSTGLGVCAVGSGASQGGCGDGNSASPPCFVGNDASAACKNGAQAQAACNLGASPQGACVGGSNPY